MDIFQLKSFSGLGEQFKCELPYAIVFFGKSKNISVCNGWFLLESEIVISSYILLYFAILVYKLEFLMLQLTDI